MKLRASLILFCLLAVTSIINSQQVISGRITDAMNGQPIEGVNIMIANTTRGTASDESGNYQVTAPGDGIYEIIVSHVGYQPVFYKIEEPKPFHQIDFSLDGLILPEIIITPQRHFRKQDVELFWLLLLGVKQSKKGLEVLNPEKVYFNLTADSILFAFCDEPIEIINHETGYLIRYVLESFRHDYRSDVNVFNGRHVFFELTPRNNIQRRSWTVNRRKVYAISVTHFIRSIFRDQLLENGFLLTKNDSLKQDNYTFFPIRNALQADGAQVLFTTDSPLYLACFSMPVNNRMIESVGYSMFAGNEEFPVVKLLPQQITIFPDGTYKGLMKTEFIRDNISGLWAKLPVEYNL